MTEPIWKETNRKYHVIKQITRGVFVVFPECVIKYARNGLILTYESEDKKKWDLDNVVRYIESPLYNATSIHESDYYIIESEEVQNLDEVIEHQFAVHPQCIMGASHPDIVSTEYIREVLSELYVGITKGGGVC